MSEWFASRSSALRDDISVVPREPTSSGQEAQPRKPKASEEAIGHVQSQQHN